ncbi:hypothetical protein [uncultured Mediterranean phage uvMED]|nr:hypothetical protein [uncultured Mediterranean phage uvMED]BAR21201.1 hypothetical protein [uncultured Mediterranean phage uvMED]BAR21258.1 hypothetical protein [uncultured Mediterranean phage uvMED]BAR21803.1 hypothetical protein [uncultured Mediterranean phage uvMED]BAR38831.1 hypothetical protein [uncultured Mediterranean phage uvMED]
MIINGAGTTQRQRDWTVQDLFNEYFAIGKLSRRKKAYMREQYLSAVTNKQIQFDRDFYNYLGDIKSPPSTLAEPDLSFKDDKNTDPHFWRGV